VPSTVDESKIDAKLKDGVLEVHLPKTKAAEPPVKKIEIKAS
jgi:HSP20 family molecular chaperone IbpA